MFEGFRSRCTIRLACACSTARNASINRDRKSTRLNSSHLVISYAVFCLKKKNVLKAKDFYLPYLEVRTNAAPRAKPYFLPSVRIEPDELPILRRAAERVAHLEGTSLAVAAQAVVRKLSFDLPDVVLPSNERTLLEPTSSSFEKQFIVVKQGLEEQRAVSCRYYAIGRDREEKRVIEPYGLMLTWGYWYCVARDRKSVV